MLHHLVNGLGPPDRTEDMPDPGYGLPRIHLPSSWVNTMRGSAPFGALPKPAHGRWRARVEDRDVPVFRVQPQFRRGATAREPLAVRGGHHPIPATVQEKGWSGDVGGVEAPRADASEIVVDEPAHAAGECGIDDVDEPRPLAGERSEEHTSELQSRQYLVCRLLLEKKKKPHAPICVSQY